MQKQNQSLLSLCPSCRFLPDHNLMWLSIASIQCEPAITPRLLVPVIILLLSSFSTEKIAEAGRKFTALKNELYLVGSLKVGPSLNTLVTSKKMMLSPEPSKKVMVKSKKKVSQLKFAFAEFYLSLILLQNYQVHAQIDIKLQIISNQT